MIVPAICFDIAKHFEGFIDGNRKTPAIEPYRDPAGYWTIGWGHLLTRNVQAPQPPAATLEQCEIWLSEDLNKAAYSIRRLCPVPLTINQYAALIDFAFNCGAGNLEVSALRQKVLRGEHIAAAEQFKRWIYSRGSVYPGLVRRRAAETALYLTPAPQL